MSVCFLTRATCKKVWNKLYTSGHCLLHLAIRIFFCQLVPHVCPLIWHFWKFHCIPLKPKILWKRYFLGFSHVFFSCNAIITWVRKCKTHDLTDHQLTVGRVFLANDSIGRDQQIQGDPDCSSINSFTLCSSRPVSNFLMPNKFVTPPPPRFPAWTWKSAHANRSGHFFAHTTLKYSFVRILRPSWQDNSPGFNHSSSSYLVQTRLLQARHRCVAAAWSLL